MKRFLTLFIVICMVFILSACNNNSKSNNGDQVTGNVKDTMNIALTQDRGTLDPSYMMGYDLMNAMRMVYEPLWDIDKDGNRIWVLATNLDMVEPTIWHITLRKEVTFANGNPFNADDVLFSLWRANNRVGEPQNFPVLNLDKTKALDDYTVEVVFDSYDLAYTYTFPLAYMYDKESFDDDKVSIESNGTGPYSVKEYVVNSHLDLTARDDYWGDKPAIKNLHFIIISEDSQRVTALQTGTVDMAGVPYQDIEFIQTLENLTVDLGPASQGLSVALYFNPSESSVFYNNPDARKAVALAIDKQAIVDVAYSGFAETSRLPVSIYNSDVENRYMDLGIYGIGYNVELAREYAERSGLVGKDVLLIDNGSSDRQVVAELIQTNLKEIGVNVSVWNLDPGSWLSVVFDDTQFDMAVDMTVAPSMTLGQNYYSWINFHIGGSYTRNPWPGNNRAMELANIVMSISDPNQLSEIYMELTELQIEAMLWYNLADLQRATAFSSSLSGYMPMLAGHVNYANLTWIS